VELAWSSGQAAKVNRSIARREDRANKVNADPGYLNESERAFILTRSVVDASYVISGVQSERWRDPISVQVSFKYRARSAEAERRMKQEM
jgi:hypothetical protein